MTILTFLLGALLIFAGFGSLLASVNLVPTEMGLLYAVCGVIAISSGFVVLAVAALIVRIDRLLAPPREPLAEPASFAPEPIVEAPTTLGEAQQGTPAAEADEEDDVNANRSGFLPTVRSVEEAIAHPEPPPQPVGRYAAGGANYVIFSDGAIEAETDEGAVRFASMGDFKSYIANRKR